MKINSCILRISLGLALSLTLLNCFGQFKDPYDFKIKVFNTYSGLVHDATKKCMTNSEKPGYNQDNLLKISQNSSLLRDNEYFVTTQVDGLYVCLIQN